MGNVLKACGAARHRPPVSACLQCDAGQLKVGLFVNNNRGIFDATK
jgi:hypothetical protein